MICASVAPDSSDFVIVCPGQRSRGTARSSNASAFRLDARRLVLPRLSCNAVSDTRGGVRKSDRIIEQHTVTFGSVAD